MKAWELIKRLEEGEKIRSKLEGGMTALELEYITNGNLARIIIAPYDYEIVVPKKKIKLYRYTCYTSIGIEQSLWTDQLVHSYLSLNRRHSIITVEEKEIEINEQ